MSGIERLKELSKAATKGPWLIHSEPEVNYPPTIHAARVGANGFHDPIEPLSWLDQEFAVAAVNFVRDHIATLETMDRANWRVEGSVYDGFEAAIADDDGTVAHVMRYGDALRIVAALNAGAVLKDNEGEGRACR